MSESKKSRKNLKRNTSDYAWIVAMFGGLALVGEKVWKERSSPEDLAAMHNAFNLLQFSQWYAPYVCFFLATGTVLCGLTLGLWKLMIHLKPTTSTKHLPEQLKVIVFNLCFVLPAYQVVWETLVLKGYTKVTMGRLDLQSVLIDCFLWMLVFELVWYAQHRLMHDNKTLWVWGHEYHHQWRKPEHMIGVTNFAFDAVVEGWVTMSTSMAPVLLFPINWYVRSTLGLLYMLLAVLVHWDFFPIRYHLDHHYYVVKNYGSHWPIFDMFFGTYQGDYFDFGAWAGKAKRGWKSK